MLYLPLARMLGAIRRGEYIKASSRFVQSKWKSLCLRRRPKCGHALIKSTQARGWSWRDCSACSTAPPPKLAKGHHDSLGKCLTRAGETRSVMIINVCTRSRDNGRIMPLVSLSETGAASLDSYLSALYHERHWSVVGCTSRRLFLLVGYNLR